MIRPSHCFSFSRMLSLRPGSCGCSAITIPLRRRQLYPDHKFPWHKFIITPEDIDWDDQVFEQVILFYNVGLFSAMSFSCFVSGAKPVTQFGKLRYSSVFLFIVSD